MNPSTRKWENYHFYLKSLDWKLKKSEWVRSGRPTMCWVCEKPMPANKSNFNFHHRTYKNLGNESLDDLVLLCRFHHEELSLQFRVVKKQRVSLEQWTWVYIQAQRIMLGLSFIQDSKIAQYMGAYNEE